MLQGSVGRVAEAADGPTALDLMGRLRPDLVLLDLRMPGGGGEHVLAEASRDEDLREIPIAVVTSVAVDDSALRRLSPTFTVLNKSELTKESLLATIRSVVGGAGKPMTATDAAQCILVVDDSEGTRFVFANWLRRAGYTVHEATTGTEAIDLLARIRFDVVLLDVNLPDMSGFDVCTHIKSTRRTAAIPVLHVSATATGPDDRSTGLIRGADGYLVEPIERDELLATVIALLRYHEARRAAERLAARLEQLHQVTLLINAASSVAELTRFASTGAAAIFGAPAIVLAARDGRGWVAKTFPDDVEAVLRFCDPAAVLALAGAAAAHEPVDLGAIGPGFTAHPQSAIHASPLTTPRGELVGAVVLLSDPSGFDDDLMDHFCQAVAVAFENQRLYAVEHQIALTLQQAMLPQSLPQPAYLDIAVRYQAASDTVEIGGDFYEAIELDDRVLLAIGDVAGHSLRAATVMAELRYSLRAFATSV